MGKKLSKKEEKNWRKWEKEIIGTKRGKLRKKQIRNIQKENAKNRK